MASRDGQFLTEEKRMTLIHELNSLGELKKAPKAILEKVATLDVTTSPAEISYGTGCLSCGEDDDHANLLLCEGCNAEYHTYCLSPPLRSVPAGDWFCAECRMPMFDDDGLDKKVNMLPPAFTSRFGEICWAQGGVGFGWWPAFIYDPRLTVGSARELARKNLGKKHLVYFFECHDAPFDCLIDSKMTKWDDGLLLDYHLGKTAKSSGKGRVRLFQQAMQAAAVELGKPVEFRMEFNHTDQPQILPSPKFKKPKRRDIITNLESPVKNAKRRNVRGFPLLSSETSADSQKPEVTVRRNLNRAIEALAVASTINQAADSATDEELFCKLLKKNLIGTSELSSLENIGFVKLPSRNKSTFEEARKLVDEELSPDYLKAGQAWRFFVPQLGPMSRKQESSLGPMYKFLRLTTCDSSLGDGTPMNPLKVVIMDME